MVLERIIIAVRLSEEIYRQKGYILACLEGIVFALGADLDLLCLLFTRDRLKRLFALIVVAVQLSGEIHR